MVVPDTVIRKLSASEAIFFYNETFAFRLHESKTRSIKMTLKDELPD